MASPVEVEVMGGSGKRQLADGSSICPNASGKLRRLRLPLPPTASGKPECYRSGLGSGDASYMAMVGQDDAAL